MVAVADGIETKLLQYAFVVIIFPELLGHIVGYLNAFLPEPVIEAVGPDSAGRQGGLASEGILQFGVGVGLVARVIVRGIT